MEYEELDNKVKLHELWLKHDKKGKRLILSNEDLSNMVLNGRNFSECVAIKTNFKGCKLIDSKFRNAILEDADFTFADLTGADFSGARMTGTIMNGISAGLDNSIESIEGLESESQCNNKFIDYDIDMIDELYKD